MEAVVGQAQVSSKTRGDDVAVSTTVSSNDGPRKPPSAASAGKPVHAPSGRIIVRWPQEQSALPPASSPSSSAPPAQHQQHVLVQSPCGRVRVSRALLQAGSFAQVFRATFEAEDGARRDIACKIARTVTQQRCLHHEARVLRHVRHRAIVAIPENFGAFDVRNPVLTALPLECAEMDLMDALQAAGGARVRALSTRFRLLLDVAEAVAHCHSLHVYHTDIKAENVLLFPARGEQTTAPLRACLADFGLAHVGTNEADRFIRRHVDGFSVAPETLDGVLFDAAAADVWSIGVTISVLATRRPPWNRASQEDPHFRRFLALGRLGGFPCDRPAGVMERLALWCLHMDPSARPTMCRVVAVLQKLCRAYLPRPDAAVAVDCDRRRSRSRSRSRSHGRICAPRKTRTRVTREGGPVRSASSPPMNKNKGVKRQRSETAERDLTQDAGVGQTEAVVVVVANSKPQIPRGEVVSENSSDE